MKDDLFFKLKKAGLLCCILLSLCFVRTFDAEAAKTETNLAGTLPGYPSNGQKYWIAFREGFRNNRVELTTCKISGNAKNAYIKWNKNLTLQGASASGSYNQYKLSETGSWEQIGTYVRFTDYASSIIASNLDVYDSQGKLILAKTNLGNYPKCYSQTSVSIKLNTANITLAKGKSYLLKAAVSGTTQKVKWSSSKKSVAAVSGKGEIKAKKAGTATITAKIGKVTKKCKVKVIDLRTPELTSWKKTHDSANCNCKIPHDGVTYTINWKKVPNASGYEISYGENESGTWQTSHSTTKKLKFSATFSHIDMKIKAKVRAYVTVNGKKIYGPWSKSITKTISYSDKGSSGGTKDKVTFKSLRGKAFTYKNSKYSFGLGFGKNNNKAYLGVWNAAGTSSSYEDFLFEIKEGKYLYEQKGLRSGFSYRITLHPYKDSVEVNIFCTLHSYNHFNIHKAFKPTKNASFLAYAN